jgi:hypothetical protein
LSKDLSSGLTNRVVVRIVLTSHTQPLAQRAIDISIKYDLWDEVFQLKMRSNETQVGTNSFSTSQQVIVFLERLKLTNLFPIQSLTDNQELVVNVEVLINPIDRERMDKVRKWVADNSTYIPPNQAGTAVGDSVVSSRPNALFNKIFEQYSAGAVMAAAWKESVASKPFRLSDLGDAR